MIEKKKSLSSAYHFQKLKGANKIRCCWFSFSLFFLLFLLLYLVVGYFIRIIYTKIFCLKFSVGSVVDATLSFATFLQLTEIFFVANFYYFFSLLLLLGWLVRYSVRLVGWLPLLCVHFCLVEFGHIFLCCVAFALFIL